MSAAMNNRALSRRFKACFYLSAINLCTMALPTLQAPYHWLLSILGIVVNVVACWFLLRNIEPSGDPGVHERLAALGRRGIFWLGLSGGAVLLTLGLTGRLGRQAIPFALFGFGYFSVALKVLGTAIDKRMEEFRPKA